MSKAVIEVSNLSKMYQIGHKVNFDLRESLISGVKNLFGSQKQTQTEEIWVLKDINFKVHKGEVLGVIGKNGAGKSTLLKILSRISEPTKGRITMKGRISSLLEVGTGFHPELTGRENIYLNGSILGMTRKEINAKFDEIIDFSGVEQFIDTPVKRYSKGMYARLAFSVAAHLEPEILLVDEVLSVGDAEFQKKSMGKMKDATGHGRTVLFISHNMNAVSNLCTRCIVLKNSRLVFNGNTDEAINFYLTDAENLEQQPKLALRTDRTGNGKIQFTDIKIEAIKENGEINQIIKTNDTLKVTLFYLTNNLQPNNQISFNIRFLDQSLNKLFTTRFSTQKNDNINIQKNSICCIIPNLPLVKGSYVIDLVAQENENIADEVTYAETFDVINRGYKFNNGCPFLLQHYWNQ